MRTRVAKLAFNRGLVSRLGLARADIKRLAMAAEIQTNWMPRVLGSMSIRPGWEHLGESASNNRAFHIPFVFSLASKALIEITDELMRVWVNDALITRPSVSSSLTNGSFSQYSDTCTISNASPGVVTYAGLDSFANGDEISFTTTGALPTPLVVGTVYYVVNVNAGANTFEVSLTPGGASINTTSAGSGTHTVLSYYFITGWTDADEVGGVSSWVTGGHLGLRGNGVAAAIRDQAVAVGGGDVGVEHALHIIVERGPVILRVGTTVTVDDDSYVSETELATGTHSLAFNPTGNFNIRFLNRLKRQVLVASCVVESSGVMTVEAPWLEVDLGLLRHDQSGDVIFVACGKTTDAIGYQQHRIERRSVRSWSVVRYYSNDGPFLSENTGPITMIPTSLSGNTTLMASAPYFKTTNVGSLFQVTSNGQIVQQEITAQNTFTSPIRVTGVDTSRVFAISVDEDAAGAATFTLQRSTTSEAGPWTDVQQWTVDASLSFDDGLDNQIVWYRLGVKTGDYVNGTHNVSLTYDFGFITGICRVTGFTSFTEVSVEVIVDFGALTASDIWAEGAWSDRRGWPTAVAFHEGRLTWSGRDTINASVSDGFDSFDQEFEGDAGPISRSIGAGPVDNINWALSLQRLLLGAEMSEFSVRASSLDEILTPTNFNIKPASTQGSAPVAAVKIDQNGAFVQRGGTRLYELSFGSDGIDYDAVHLSALVPEIGEPGIIRLVVQRQPDTRLHCVRSDGTVAILIFDKTEQVICWLEIDTDGLIEDAVVLPGDAGEEEDHVYYSVNRTVDAVVMRSLEKWAFESECRGDAQLCKLADSFVTYTGAPATVIPVPHLVGEEVVVWADGEDVGTDDDGSLIYTVSGMGEITLASAASNVVVGLPYTAPWKSAKLVELMESLGGSITDTQLIKAIALVLADVHAKGLKYGRSLTESEMEDLPESVDGQVVDPDAVRADYTMEGMMLKGEWTEDERLCLLAKAPRPCTVLAALAEVEHHG